MAYQLCGFQNIESLSSTFLQKKMPSKSQLRAKGWVVYIAVNRSTLCVILAKAHSDLQ